MPSYEVEHVFILPPAEQDALAEAITAIHSEAFGVPRLFVHVRFVLTTEARDYVAGRPRRTNRIRAFVRSGGARSQQQWDDVALKLAHAWRDTLHPGQDLPDDTERELRAVLLMGGLVAGWEVGFVLPTAGGDAQWAKDNAAAIRDRAAANDDDDLKALVRELEERDVFGGDPSLAERRAAEEQEKQKQKDKQ